MRDWTPLDVLPDLLMDLPDPVIAFTRDGRYLFVNTVAAGFLRRDPFDMIGSTWRELGLPAHVMEPLTDRVASVADSGKAEHYRLVGAPEYGSRVFDMSLTPIWSEDGNVLAVLAISHDITEFFTLVVSEDSARVGVSAGS